MAFKVAGPEVGKMPVYKPAGSEKSLDDGIKESESAAAADQRPAFRTAMRAIIGELGRQRATIVEGSAVSRHAHDVAAHYYAAFSKTSAHFTPPPPVKALVLDRFSSRLTAPSSLGDEVTLAKNIFIDFAQNVLPDAKSQSCYAAVAEKRAEIAVGCLKLQAGIYLGDEERVRLTAEPQTVAKYCEGMVDLLKSMTASDCSDKLCRLPPREDSLNDTSWDKAFGRALHGDAELDHMFAAKAARAVEKVVVATAEFVTGSHDKVCAMSGATTAPPKEALSLAASRSLLKKGSD